MGHDMHAWMPSPQALWLGVILATLLVVSSLISAAIRLRSARGQPHPEIDNLTARVRSWWIIIAVLSTALWGGIWTTFGVFSLISLTALREYVARPLTHRAITWGIGVVICVVCIAFIPALLTLRLSNHEGSNALLVAYLILVTQISDVSQYIWGKLLGKHRIVPRISPSKTIEGFIGGVLTATLVGAALWWITPFSPSQAAGVSLLLTLLGFAGGLIMSAQKRARGIKDWGTLIAGHGGVLDRLDSLWLSAPAFYAILRFGWADH